MIALVLVRTCTGLRRYFVHCTERISDKQSFLYVPRAGSEILDGPTLGLYGNGTDNTN